MVILRTALGTFGWRQSMLTLRLLIGGVILAILLIGGVLALRIARPAAPTQVMPGQRLAWDMAQAVGRSAGVQTAAGAYLPGDTLMLYSRINEADRTQVRAWALTQLEPFADRLATMSANETLKWVIDFGPTPAEQEVIIAPLNRAADSTLYRYISAAPGIFNASGATTDLTTTTAPDSAAAPTVGPGVVAQATTQVMTKTAPAQGASRSLTFDQGIDIGQDWLPLSGDWAASNGIYSQRNKSGYDSISMLRLDPQTHYSLAARLRLVEGEMGGGFIYNAPSQSARAGAQIVDLDKQGSFLRWGRYDDNGTYVYISGGQVDPPLNDGQWHSFQLLTHATMSTVSVDGRVIGQITNASAGGYLGLTTSKAHVDFDNVSVTVLPQTGGAPATMPVAASGVTVTVATISNTVAFTDSFTHGNGNGWRVLNGAWQFVDQTYQQLSTAGTDLGSISTFQGETYTVSVRLRRLDGNMGGGVYFNMGQRDAKMRSQMINYTQNGKAIQWGHFDEGGNFVFEGIATVPDGNDGRWHMLVVRVRGGKGTFTLDGKQMAKNVALTYTNGYVGLLVSASKVAFDDIKIVTQ